MAFGLPQYKLLYLRMCISNDYPIASHDHTFEMPILCEGLQATHV